MSKKVGMNCKLYRSATLLSDENGPADATWVEIKNCRDLSLGGDTGETDMTTRGNNGFKATLATLKDPSIEFEMLWDTEDASLQAIKTAWLAGDEIALAVMDGAVATVGSEGLAANFAVLNFGRNEPLSEGVMAAVTVKPSGQAQWYTVSGS